MACRRRDDSDRRAELWRTRRGHAHAGGQYVYLRESLGPLWGFLYGWTMLLVIQTATIAAVAIAFAKFTAVIVPWFSASDWIWKIGTFGPWHFGSVDSVLTTSA